MSANVVTLIAVTAEKMSKMLPDLSEMVLTGKECARCLFLALRMSSKRPHSTFLCSAAPLPSLTTSSSCPCKTRTYSTLQ